MTIREQIAASRHPLIAALFLACAIALGGGGTPNPRAEVLLQLAFVAAALAWLWIPAQRAPAPVPRTLLFWLLCIIVLAVPLLQLVPVPPSVWRDMAAQESRAAALALVGREDSWQPLSQSPARTLASVLAMIPALFAFFAAAALDMRGRLWMVGAAAAMAFATSLLGAAQVSLGVMSAPYLYAQNSPTLTGFQANRNAAADVLLIGMAATAAFLMPVLAARKAAGGSRGRAATWRTSGAVLAGLLIVLFFAVVLTASRTGIALLAVALGAVWLILLPLLSGNGGTRRWPTVAALLAIPVLAFATWQVGNTALGAVAQRFAESDDGRAELWRDGWFATTQAWPFGVGTGGAQTAMIAAERLEVLQPALPNRVHNDYLEFALEGGLAAVVALGLVALLLLWAAWRSWRDRPLERHLTVFGIAGLLIVALHSFVDYPLRSMALACLVGTCAGMLMRPPRNLAAFELGA